MGDDEDPINSTGCNLSMVLKNSDFEIQTLGECPIPSPMHTAQFVGDEERILYHAALADIQGYLGSGEHPPSFEMAGPRRRLFFDPSKLKCGIVTCGGLCPGLNDVIRSIALCLFHHYGVRTVFGFRYGYEGLTCRVQDTNLLNSRLTSLPTFRRRAVPFWIFPRAPGCWRDG